ncbi:type II toxin-antitoxin system antitoxin [Treponema sp.]
MKTQGIVDIIVRYYADIQAIYLFGSYGTSDERPQSDVDIALLLPVDRSKCAGNLALSPAASELALLLGRDIDLINLRLVDTVFQNQIVGTGRIILKRDVYETELFEMLSLSFYQKLNQERASIIEQIARTKSL